MAEKNYSSFYAYTHARPDGTVFYVGKGCGRRAWDLSPSRRALHHRNIVNKYGLDAIVVTIFPTDSEDSAFALERKMIADFAASGVLLINRTDGGEGASGVKATGARVAALAKGRLSWDKRGISEDSKARMLAAALKGRPAADAWRASPEGVAHTKTLAARSAAATALRVPNRVTCCFCGEDFWTKSLHRAVRYCGKACQQRGRAAEIKAASPIKAAKVYKNNSSGRTGVYWNEHARVWVALIGVGGKIVYLGRYTDMSAATAARELAESQYGRNVP